MTLQGPEEGARNWPTTTLKYDANGNRVEEGTRRYAWDIRDTLTQVTDGASVLGVYDYDASLQRVKADTAGGHVEYVLDGKYVLRESGARTRRYHYGEGKGLSVDDGGGARWLSLDGLGSTSAELTPGGSVTANRKHDAWGNYRDGTAPASGEVRLGYTGHQYDVETGLTYARARYYDSVNGVFLSRDTEAGDPSDAPSLHRYAYAHGNPVRYVDIDGTRAGDTPQQQIERVKREILQNSQQAKDEQRGNEHVVREGLSEHELDEQWQFANEDKSSLPVLPTSSERSMAEFRESGKQWVNRLIFAATLGVGGLGSKLATGAAKRFGLRVGTEAALDVALNTVEGYIVGAGTEVGRQSVEQAVDERAAYDLGKVHEAGLEGAKSAFSGSVTRVLFRGLFGRAGAEPVEVRSKVGESGELRSAFAKIEPQNIGGGTDTNESSRRFVRMLGRETDDAGHAIGSNLGGRGIVGGPTNRNVFPQDPAVNQGAFRVFEQQVARRVEAGDQVFVRVVPIYGPASTRPSSVLYQVRINGKTSSQVFPNP